MKSIYESGADHGGDVPGHHRLQINGLQQPSSEQLLLRSPSFTGGPSSLTGTEATSGQTAGCSVARVVLVLVNQCISDPVTTAAAPTQPT